MSGVVMGVHSERIVNRSSIHVVNTTDQVLLEECS